MKKSLRMWVVILMMVCWTFSTGANVDNRSLRQEAEPKRPNVLIILADDLGYSDLGCYGSEVATPNLDGLAKKGLRFSQFYNTARCWPSRASLLTGYYAHQVRRDAVPGVKSGGSGVRPSWAKLLPAMLKPLGYRAYHSGKWHIDGGVLAGGFDRSYNLTDHDRYFNPRSHSENDKPLPSVEAGSGYYSSTAIADYTIKYLKEHASGYSAQPFLAYVAFTAPHFPIQALPEDIAKYRKRYEKGWDALREERWKRMKRFGLGGNTLSGLEREIGAPYPFPEAIKSLGANEVSLPREWKSLTPEQKAFQTEKMAIHAAMVERMDREIGRILDQLRAMNRLEDTLILFVSDNGASAEMMVRGDGHKPDAPMGSAGSYLSLGPGWSGVANTPFRRHKSWVHEGGIATPFIMSWERGIRERNQLRHTPAHLIDVVPTLMELTGISSAPENPALPGKSLVPLFAKQGTITRDALWWQHEGNRALRQGDWKIVAAGRNSPWELYEMKADRNETTNLATKMPEKVQELSALWNRMAEEFYTLARKPD